MSENGILRLFEEIDALEVKFNKMLAALNEIKRLHAARVMPDGQMWCDCCCFDESGHQTEDCAQSHDHRIGWAACATTEIIARAGL